MAFPGHVDYVIVGAGIHCLATAWRLAERLTEDGKPAQGRIVVLDKGGIAAGATGIACGVVRNNYFQPAMRNLMAHSVAVWESDPEAFSYHGVGYCRFPARPCAPMSGRFSPNNRPSAMTARSLRAPRRRHVICAGCLATGRPGPSFRRHSGRRSAV